MQEPFVRKGTSFLRFCDTFGQGVTQCIYLGYTKLHSCEARDKGGLGTKRTLTTIILKVIGQTFVAHEQAQTANITRLPQKWFFSGQTRTLAFLFLLLVQWGCDGVPSHFRSFRCSHVCSVCSARNPPWFQQRLAICKENLVTQIGHSALVSLVSLSVA
eukprot:3052841-Amphidinium_carterae.1